MNFLITTHAHLPGARLSKLGDRGNIPFGSIDECRAEAARMAKGKAHNVEVKHFKGVGRG